MHYALGHDKAFPGLKINRAPLKVNDEVSVQHEEKFVVLVMLVPVIFALHHAETHYRIVYLAKRLVVPPVRARLDQRGYIHLGQCRKLDIQKSCIRIGFIVFHVQFTREHIYVGLNDTKLTDLQPGQAAVSKRIPTIIKSGSVDFDCRLTRHLRELDSGYVRVFVAVAPRLAGLGRRHPCRHRYRRRQRLAHDPARDRGTASRNPARDLTLNNHAILLSFTAGQ